MIRPLMAATLAGAALPMTLFTNELPAQAQTQAHQTAITLVYPPEAHQTTAEQIFLIGTAPEPVTVNGQPIHQSPAGHFAPSFPLDLGENRFVLEAGDATRTVLVIRNAAIPPLPENGFAEGLVPAVDVARQVGEPFCFEAIAPAGATVTVSLSGQTLALMPEPQVVLPSNFGVLTERVEPLGEQLTYRGCTLLDQVGDLGQPSYRMTLGEQRVTEAALGRIQVWPRLPEQVATVTADSGTARTGPSTTYSRLTPLPTGTQAAVTGREGDWWRLDYGAWIRASEVSVSAGRPPRSLIRGVLGRVESDRTTVTFPLQTPVPVSVDQQGDSFTLTLHNTTAQTDTIRLDDSPVVERLDWSQPAPDQVRYQFQLKSSQLWGYSLQYEGTSLVLTLRHPPALSNGLAGATILLDPGHGSDEDLGARGPTGLPEKDVVLTVTRQLRDALEARGAAVVLTREGDEDLFPRDRVAIIEETAPTIALSLHYNALPDDGDAEGTAGISTFWYHAQAHDLAVFLHNHLVETLDRPTYGVYWNNLALTRPAIAPAVLLELGFMIHPEEFEWISDPEAQAELVAALAAGIEDWLVQRATAADADR